MIAIEHSTPLKNHVLALIILNIIDGTLTYIGLTFGFITEGNPLLSSFSPISIFAAKLLLSLCLFCLLYTPIVFSRSSVLRYALISANALYSMILLLHIFWLTYLFV